MLMNREKLNELIMRDNKIMEFLTMSKEDLRADLGAEFSMMKDYDQKNAHHCYSLLEHTLRTVTGIDVKEHAAKDALELRIAALYHDIGKPSVAFWDMKRKQRRFFGHAKKSRDIAEKLLQQMKYSEDQRIRILFYIEFHDEFMSYCTPLEKQTDRFAKAPVITKENVLKNIREKGQRYQMDIKTALQLFEKLMDLRMADAMAQSEEVWIGGERTATKTEKVDRILLIRKIIHAEMEKLKG